MLPMLAALAPMFLKAGTDFGKKIAERDRNDVNRQEEEARLKARAALSNRFQEQPDGAAPQQPPVPPVQPPPPVQGGAQQNPVMGAVGGAMQGLMGSAAKPDEDNPFLSMARGYLGR